jgi:uncharacterized cupredoxin-like copper-binding protein
MLGSAAIRRRIVRLGVRRGRLNSDVHARPHARFKCLLRGRRLVRERMLRAGGWRASWGACVLFALAASSAAAPASTAASVTRVDVTLSDFAIRLSADRVPRGRVVFRIVNRGNVPHGFTIAGRQTGTLPHGRRASLSAVLSRPGRYRFASGQPGDAAVGMAGSLRVGPAERPDRLRRHRSSGSRRSRRVSGR